MVCSNPKCRLAGVDQPEENFYHWSRICKACKIETAKSRYHENKPVGAPANYEDLHKKEYWFILTR